MVHLAPNPAPDPRACSLLASSTESEHFPPPHGSICGNMDWGLNPSSAPRSQSGLGKPEFPYLGNGDSHCPLARLQNEPTGEAQ